MKSSPPFTRGTYRESASAPSLRYSQPVNSEHTDGQAVVRARFEREGRERTRRGARIYCAFCLALVVLSAIYSWAWELDIALQEQGYAVWQG